MEIGLGHLLGDTSGAEAEIVAARDDVNGIGKMNFDLVYDGFTITIFVDQLSSVGMLLSHIQGAVDQAMSGSSAGVASSLDLNPVFKVECDRRHQ